MAVLWDKHRRLQKLLTIYGGACSLQTVMPYDKLKGKVLPRTGYGSPEKG